MDLAKKLFKYQNSSPKAFLGIINLEKNVSKTIPISQISKYQNIMIASDYGEDFITKLTEV